jgi:molecular chaperone Hsp33
LTDTAAKTGAKGSGHDTDRDASQDAAQNAVKDAAKDAARLSLDVNLDDMVMPFAVPELDARGRIVRLGPALDDAISRHGYPEPVARVLAEAVALTALLGTSLKFEGRFILQTQTDGPISMLVVDFETPGRFRACLRHDARAIAAMGPRPETAGLLGKGTLAMTIDQGAHMSRYQGVVPLDAKASLEEAAHLYFAQSEQIPTQVRLAAALAHRGSAAGAVDTTPHWRAGGVLVQYLPDGAAERMPDLDPGDPPEGSALAPDPTSEPDAWRTARLLAETTEDHEIIDPDIPAGALLYRLYHEQGVRVFEAQPLSHNCNCSKERIGGILTQLSQSEREGLDDDNGEILVTCEFCAQEYRFDPSEIESPQ